MTDEEKAVLATELKCHLYDDLTIRLEDSCHVYDGMYC